LKQERMKNDRHTLGRRLSQVPSLTFDAPSRQMADSLLLGSDFRVHRVSLTGLGLAEWVNLPLLVVCRYFLVWERAYQILRVIFWLVYLLEELFPLPLGRLSWHLMVVAMKEQREPHGEKALWTR
jgi:hypothetical protein